MASPNLSSSLSVGAKRPARHLRLPELSVRLLREGYHALPRLRAGAEDEAAYPARLGRRRALVVRGEEGARLFYDESLVRRHGAVPAALAGLLFGPGAVHGTDDEVHRARKRLFLEVLTAEQVTLLRERIRTELDRAAATWTDRGSFPLHDELVRVYGAAVLEWAGTGVEAEGAGETERVSRDLAAIVAGFGFAPRAYVRGWLARRRVDRWARRVVRAARAGELRPRPGSAVDMLSHGGGRELPLDLAAVELVNVVRPTVAVAWLACDAALALTEHPDWGARLAAEDGDADRAAFADEVRRHYPFVPALAARVRTTWTFRGHRLTPGELVVLDVPGTNHDPARWRRPEEFLPDRFLAKRPDAYEFVPQGGGEPLGHRCPGEGAAQTLLEETLRVLARTAYAVDDARLPLDRIPPLPARGMLLRGVRSG